MPKMPTRSRSLPRGEMGLEARGHRPVNRRGLARLGVLALVGGLLSLVGGGATAAAAPPNILFLLSDDHSAPYLGCYGYADVRTPNLDRFAAEGMRFDRMFVTCPQCVPSRASLMTGQSPVAVRMVRFTSPLPPDVRALPDLLRDQAGYFTGVGGRTYHLDGPPGGRRRRGGQEPDGGNPKPGLETSW